MKSLIRSLATLATLAAAAQSQAVTYTLEPNYTQVMFSWDHLGYSSPTAQIAQGTGTLMFDEMEPSMASIKVTLPLASLHTGVPELDEHLKAEDFFDVAKFPQAVFASTRVEKGMSADLLKVTGDLTLHGITKPVTLEVKLLKVGANPRNKVPTVGFNATGRISRTAFGLGAFVPQVGDEIVLQVTCQGAEAKAYAAFLKAKEEKAKTK